MATSIASAAWSSAKPATPSSASSRPERHSSLTTAPFAWPSATPNTSAPSPPTTAPSSSYPAIERALGLQFYFATPHHAWERGTNENTNGLIRQYLPKRTSMASLTQHDCNVIAHKLNTRPRKRLDYQTPEECFYAQ